MPLQIRTVLDARNVVSFRKLAAVGVPALFSPVEQIGLVVLDELWISIPKPFLQRTNGMIALEFSFVNFASPLPARQRAVSHPRAIGDLAAFLASFIVGRLDAILLTGAICAFGFDRARLVIFVPRPIQNTAAV